MEGALRIAIADDNATFRHQLKKMLQTLGHEIAFVVETGRQLVDQCLLAPPDLVISDIRMPDMDGLEATRIIHLASNIPVILISASCEPECILRAEQTHALTYLVKPLAQEHLETALALVIEQRKAAAAGQNAADSHYGTAEGLAGVAELDGAAEVVRVEPIRPNERFAVPRSPADTGRIPQNAGGFGHS